MNWKELSQEVVNGTTTAVVWAVFLWLAGWMRNYVAERRLRKTMERIGVIHRAGPNRGDRAFGVSIHNKTEYDIIVRSVTLLTKKPDESFALQFSDKEYEYMFQEKPFKDPRSMKHYSWTEIGPRSPLVNRSAELGPFTTGTWMAVAGVFTEHPDLVVTRCHIEIQYRSLLGNPKLLVVESNGQCSEHLEKAFMQMKEKLREELAEPVGVPNANTRR